MTTRRVRTLALQGAVVLAVFSVGLLLYVRAVHPAFRSAPVPGPTPEDAVVYLSLRGLPLTGAGIYHCTEDRG
jgi:hypothetical protein